MADHAVILIGGPDSGKTNYLARLWKALSSQDGALFAPDVPNDIRYVEEALAHLLQGIFAPRSDKNFDEIHQSFSVPVVLTEDPHAEPVQVVVPDVTGELWQTAVETCELPEQWMTRLRTASGALVFVRIGSDQNVDPLDWVTADQLLQMPAMAPSPEQEDKRKIPTQVLLCELLRFLEYGLAADLDNVRPRVAVLVTAWDRLDVESRAKGPSAYIAEQYPLLAGRLNDISEFDIRVFGVSIVGGDFIDTVFQEEFFKADLKDVGYVELEADGEVQTKLDVTLPVAWVIRSSDCNEQ
jgi:hypothetical protein